MKHPVELIDDMAKANADIQREAIANARKEARNAALEEAAAAIDQKIQEASAVIDELSWSGHGRQAEHYTQLKTVYALAAAAIRALKEK
jgi:hypothetical protein